jgi:hypothetical protein
MATWELLALGRRILARWRLLLIQEILAGVSFRGCVRRWTVQHR